MSLSIPAIAIEKSLLRGEWSAAASDGGLPTASHLAQAVLEGRFRDVLTSPTARDLFHITSSTFDRPFDQALSLPKSDEAEEAELARLILAVACLHAFVQVNWTGPDLDIQPSEVVSLSTAPESSPPLTDDFLNQKAVSELALAGEPAYHLTKVAAFLRLAQVLFSAPFKRCVSATWWKLRATFVHQQVLDEPVALPDSLSEAVDNLRSVYSAEPDLDGRLVLEQGLLQHQFSNGREASERFVQAAKATGLVYELTGALGKRTKFQQFELSQLVLLAESHLVIGQDGVQKGAEESPPSVSRKTADIGALPTAPAESEKPNQQSGPAVPETLALNDDTLLEQTEFTSSNPSAEESLLGHIDPSSQPPLHPLDQCILLSMCLNVKNTSPAHGLTNEQMSPYVARVISHPRNWSIHTMALLLRSRLESSRTRTIERSTLQLQALIDQMPTSDSTLQERMLYFHSLPLPSKWELERELALRFLGLGAVKSAMEIFERLEMWEEVVKCWGALERPEKGIAIVRDLLEGRKQEADEVISQGKMTSANRRRVRDKAREAKLWCLLGDLESAHAQEHYERAWKVSEGTSGRAMRSLGGYYFARGNFKGAITALKKAVAINPLLAKSWFILGCSCMRVEDWEAAKNAFSRCVAIDEEDGESWNNLASMYLRAGQAANVDPGKKDETSATTISINPSIPFENRLLAFRALKHGLRFSYENWRMWYNYMIVSMDVGELSEACRALGRVVEERGDKYGEKAVDEDVLDRLVNAVTRDENANDDDATNANSAGAGGVTNVGPGLSKNVASLLENTILPRASSPRIFRAYARLLTWQERWEEAVKAHLDAYRCGVAGTIHETAATATATTTTGSGSGGADGADAALERWKEGVREVEDIVDVLTNFGPRVDEQQQGGGSGSGKKWRMQGRSIVRTFMGRTKDFEDEPEWEKLVELERDLRNE